MENRKSITTDDILSIKNKLDKMPKQEPVIIMSLEHICDCGSNSFNMGVWELFCTNCNKINDKIFIDYASKNI